MFDNLQERLGEVFDRLKRRGALSESDVSAALREVRVALLEADVALPVVKDFVDAVREKAIGQEVLRSVDVETLVVGITSDRLYLPQEQVEIAETIPGARLRWLRGPHGHDGFLIETAALNDIVTEFRHGRDHHAHPLAC